MPTKIKTKDMYSNVQNVGVFEGVNLTTKDPKVGQLLLNKLGNKCTVSGKYGTGAAKCIGCWDPINSVFLGKMEAQDLFLVRFVGEEGSKVFEDFRKTFPTFDQLKMSSGSVIVVLNPLTGVTTATDFETSSDEIVANQQSSKPKVTISKGIVSFGGKTSQQQVEIEPLISASLLQKVVVRIKVSGEKADLLFQQIIKNPAASAVVCFVNLALEFWGKFTMTPFLQVLRAKLTKHFNVSSINVPVVKKSVAKGLGFKSTVKRNFTAISNKLQDPTTSQVTKEDFLFWIQHLYDNRTNIPECKPFFVGILGVVNGAKGLSESPTVSKAPTPSLEEVMGLSSSSAPPTPTKGGGE